MAQVISVCIPLTQVTYADFAVYVLMECLIPEMPGSPSDHFPHIAGLMTSVKSLNRY